MGTLHVCFLWHMHQPSYVDPTTGEAVMPWVRLHAAKDYTEMAVAAATHGDAHVTFNWVPGLMDQLDAAASLGGPYDRFERLTRTPAESLSPEEQTFLRRAFFSLNHETMLQPWARYRELKALADNQAMTADDLRDLQVWFNLAWCGDTTRAKPEVEALTRKARGFSEEDKEVVLRVHHEAAAAVAGRYAALAATGQVELSCSPYYHPILPLLVDTDNGRVADPSTPLPTLRFAHPGDARAQIDRAVARHAEVFGLAPRGMWPSEGSVAPAVLPMLREAGVRWITTDEAILHKSMSTSARSAADRYGPWDADGVAIFFRDHELSDRVGFVYGRWEPEHAIRDMVGRLTDLHRSLGQREAVVTIALDGENCWETYRGGVHAFLPGLYRAIADAPGLRLSTMSEALEAVGTTGRSISRLGVGSWIDGTFRTWIGDPAKNRAWELLTAARDAVGAPLDEVAQEDPELAQLVMKAEASDWFWWLGYGHSSVFDAEFDELFRRHVLAIYQRLGRPAPPALDLPVDPAAAAGAQAQAAVSAPVLPGRPAITGLRDDYYKWVGAGRILPSHGAMHGATTFQEVRYCFDEDTLSLRVDTRGRADRVLATARVALRVRCAAVGQRPGPADSASGKGGGPTLVPLWPAADTPAGAEVACGSVLEARVPRGACSTGDATVAHIQLVLQSPEGAVLEITPPSGVVTLDLDVEHLARRDWVL